MFGKVVGCPQARIESEDDDLRRLNIASERLRDEPEVKPVIVASELGVPGVALPGAIDDNEIASRKKRLVSWEEIRGPHGPESLPRGDEFVDGLAPLFASVQPSPSSSRCWIARPERLLPPALTLSRSRSGGGTTAFRTDGPGTA